MKNFLFNNKKYGIYLKKYTNGDIFMKCYTINDKVNGNLIVYNEIGNSFANVFYKSNTIITINNIKITINNIKINNIELNNTIYNNYALYI